ncbi:MAG: hypothetical protein KatS3mg121_0437 [Gammaproteobacteria bacterium]|nr:MAG: hypothetical protein KatS3mg121_0437 [Gammaproteobacteria bacterium]
MSLQGELARLRAAAGRLAASAELHAGWRRFEVEQMRARYADLARDPLCRPAVEFLIDELYGNPAPLRLAEQLERARGPMETLLPAKVRHTVGAALAFLAAKLERDAKIVERAARFGGERPDWDALRRAVYDAESWRAHTEAAVAVGREIDRLVHKPLIGVALRACAAPARRMGLGYLQDFLERGYAAFRRLGDAAPFLARFRERELAAWKDTEPGGG